MGLGSFLKKSIKNAFKGGSLAGLTDKLSDKATAPLKDALGLNAFADIAGGQAEQMRLQAEQMKLQNANSFDNVVQFEDGGTNLGGSDQRVRKRPTGTYGSGLGLNL